MKQFKQKRQGRLNLTTFKAESLSSTDMPSIEQLLGQVLGACHDPERDGYGRGPSSSSSSGSSGSGGSGGGGGGSDRSN